MTVATPAQALALIEKESQERKNIGVGDCQYNVRRVYGLGSGAGSAAIAWQNAKFKHTDFASMPLGAFVFWTGGHTLYQGKPAGHVAVNAGNGKVWTPGGPKDADHWYLTDIHEVATGTWSAHTLVGWTEDENGKRIPGLEPTVAKKAPKKTAADKIFEKAKTAQKRAHANGDHERAQAYKEIKKAAKELSFKY